MVKEKSGELKPTVWIKRVTYGYEMYVYNPGQDPRWLEFDTFEDLVQWMAENPGVLLSQEDLDKEYLQLSFEALNPTDIGKKDGDLNG